MKIKFFEAGSIDNLNEKIEEFFNSNAIEENKIVDIKDVKMIQVSNFFSYSICVCVLYNLISEIKS